MQPMPRKIAEKLRKLTGQLCCQLQHNQLRSTDKNIVTIFHDVEGDYAIHGKQAHCLDALDAMLDIESKYGIQGTFCTVAKFAADVPDLMQEITSRGHEIAGHSYEHGIMNCMNRVQQISDIQRTKDTFSELGLSVIGHRSPQSAWDHHMMRQLLREGFLWSAENGVEPYPYVISRMEGRLLWRFPIRGDDWSYEKLGLMPQEMLEKWKGIVERGREKKEFTALGFHPWVEAPSERLAIFKEFVAWLTSLPDIEVMPFRDVLELLEETEQSNASTDD